MTDFPAYNFPIHTVSTADVARHDRPWLAEAHAEYDTVDAYQAIAAATAVYPGVGHDQLLYPVLGLVDEACELAERALRLLTRQAHWDRPEVRPVVAVLDLAAAVGTVCGLLKKTHRDAQGVLDEPRRRRLGEALAGVERARKDAALAFKAAPYVVLPAVTLVQPLADVDERAGFLLELGDCAWYAAQAATEAHARLLDVLVANSTKLADRAARGAIHGSGDHR